MSTQERDRKHIMYGLIAMVILSCLPACTNMPAEKQDQSMGGGECGTPTTEQALATLQRNAELMRMVDSEIESNFLDASIIR